MTLQALRAGPMTSTEMEERWSFGSNYAQELLRAGLVELVKEGYSLTDAGRSACPFRNPLAAKPAIKEVFIMPKGETHVTRQQVLAVILAGGAAGATRRQLIEKFAGRATEQAIDMHLTALNRQRPVVIFKPRPGVLVGIQYVPEPAEIAPEAASTATDDWIPEPLATDPAPAVPIVYAVENLDVEQITARPVVFDTELDNPDQVEFCIYSSGGFDMLTEQGTISLAAPVLKKLRSFLGILAEAA